MWTKKLVRYKSLILHLFLLLPWNLDARTALLYPLEGDHSVPSFTFERTDSATELVDRYLDKEGNLAIKETLLKDENGGIRSYLYHQAQIGSVGGLDIVGDSIIVHRLNEGVREEKRFQKPEKLLFGAYTQEFIQEHWEDFAAGKKVYAEVPVTFRLTTTELEFYIDENLSSQDEENWVLVMRPSSWFIRLFIDRDLLHVSRDDLRLVELRGPSLLRNKVDGKWKMAQVRVVYQRDMAIKEEEPKSAKEIN